MRREQKRRWGAWGIGLLLLLGILVPPLWGEGRGWPTELLAEDNLPAEALVGLPFVPTPPSADVGQLGISAASAVLIEATTGRVLYAKNAVARRPMASTTKIMTGLVSLEVCDPSETVTVPKEAVGIEGSSVYLVEGERLTVGELVYALMLASANDAATALALAIDGSVEAFAERMTRKAVDLGLIDTSFANPHGLDAEEHYTTAYDLACLTAYALQNPTFRTVVATVKTTIPLNGTAGARLLVNHNRLLRSYEGCIGVKTGYTKRCGRCLVTAAERDGVTLIAVTLNASDDWNDHRRMLDFGFAGIERISLLPDGMSGLLAVVGGEGESVRYTVAGTSVLLPRKEHTVRYVTELPRFAYAPIAVGDLLGRVVVYDGDSVIASLPIVAAEDLPQRQERRGFLAWLRSLF